LVNAIFKVIRPVLCHGDFWANNLFFERLEEDGNAAGDELCAIIDWQTPHASQCFYYLICHKKNIEIADRISKIGPK
jgi:thiamine kinase-like enzyme